MTVMSRETRFEPDMGPHPALGQDIRWGPGRSGCPGPKPAEGASALESMAIALNCRLVDLVAWPPVPVIPIVGAAEAGVFKPRHEHQRVAGEHDAR
jgi:hypothetical protein